MFPPPPLLGKGWGGGGSPTPLSNPQLSGEMGVPWDIREGENDCLNSVLHSCPGTGLSPAFGDGGGVELTPVW